MMPRTYTFTLAPLNPSDSVDLVPAADPPPEQELEPVALKMRPQCPQSLLSGSKPASTSEIHTPVTSFSLASCYVCHASMPPVHISTSNSRSSSKHLLSQSRSRYCDCNTSCSRSSFSRFRLAFVFPNVPGPRWHPFEVQILTQYPFVPDDVSLVCWCYSYLFTQVTTLNEI